MSPTDSLVEDILDHLQANPDLFRNTPEQFDQLKTLVVDDRLNERKGGSKNAARSEGVSLLRRSLLSLLIYYATTLGVPLANGAYRAGTASADFWEHSLFVFTNSLNTDSPARDFAV